MQIRRFELFLWLDPSIRRYFCSNPDPHYLKRSFRRINLLHTGIYIYIFFFSWAVFRFYLKFSAFSGETEKKVIDKTPTYRPRSGQKFQLIRGYFQIRESTIAKIRIRELFKTKSSDPRTYFASPLSSRLHSMKYYST